MVIDLKNNVLLRWLAPILVLFVVMQLTGCGNKELEQRKAFIEFLQNTVMRGGVHLPTLSENQKQKLGNYAHDYAILFDFSQQFSTSVEASLVPVLDQMNQIRTAQDYLNKHDTLQQSLGTLNLLTQQLQTAKQKADSAYVGLKQPDDLKTVYDQAYDKVVTLPTNTLMSVLPNSINFVQSVLQVGNFLKIQGDQVTFNQNGVQFRTQQQVTQYNAMMAHLISTQQDWRNAQNAVQRLMQ